ncbi:MAG: tyrosine--tRNA ligase [Bacilli bacterium]|nr:tyrosine--tRNA ligase [Bacilli bacterium]
MNKNIVTDEQIDLVLRRAEKMISEESIRKRIKSGEKITIKLGADPSRPDLHLGHTVVLRALKHLQNLGAEIVFVIGDFTAMIGDPTGKSKTRPSLTFEETKENGKTYFEQVGKILDLEKTKVVYNSEWLSKMSFEDVIKLTSKYTVARIMERDDFENRYKNNSPIGIHEFLYPLMQGYDSVALHADIEVGGTDQTFNLLVGRELQKDYNQEPQDIMVFPLLVGLDGKEKMSKSLGNYIGISDSAEVMYEKAMRIPDKVLPDYFRLTTDIEPREYEKIIDTDIIEAHKMYAQEIITMYHGKEFIKDAEERYQTVAKGSAPIDIETIEIGQEKIENEYDVLSLLVDINLLPSKSEARRMVEQNGIKFNGDKMNDIKHILSKRDFENNELIIQKGKKNFIKLVLK